MAKGYMGNASSKAYPLSKGWVGNGSNKAYPLKAGWMGDVNGKARKVFGAAGYIWQKYAVTTTQGYREVAGESETENGAGRTFYVGNSYSFDATTGQFTVTQDISISYTSTGANTAIGKYYINLNGSSGTYSGTTLYLITNAIAYPAIMVSLTVTPYTAELTTIQAKGDLLGTVTSEDISAYPINGVADDGYWYVLQGIPEFTYSGSYSCSAVVIGGQNYLLLEITGSGTYSSTQATTADIWICGGGASGGGKTSSLVGQWDGGGGGYTAQANSQSFTTLSISIGSGGSGNSSDGSSTGVGGDISLSANGGHSHSQPDGGSGGGGGGAGQGTTTYLFADSTLNLYCGGGGAGGYSDEDNYNHKKGGDGGSNGSDGGNNSHVESSTSAVGGAGGLGGGGAGGSRLNAGEAATAYGGGGGGGGINNSTYRNGGAGYQGVCFIRIPLN